ncbi:MAG TPA: hypothetical protein VHM30_13145, partial [Gemmatimonadaceae bacterium]|nr:hypothetical protein [Gemmatimonadaceae bacterium]
MPVVRSTPRRAWALLAATFSLTGAIGTNAAAQESPDSTAHVVTPRSPLAVLGARTVTIYPDSFPDAPRSLTALLAMAVPEVFVQRASGATAAGAWLSMRDGAAARGEQPLVVVDGIKTVAAVPRVAQATERRAPSR